ncbi:MAG TPA: hypothetical protein ENN17_04750 [bacterium]|nr:hypothetical protein [bacterium]
MKTRAWFSVLLAAGLMLGCGEGGMRISARRTDAFPKLFPDLIGVTIPPNIAPLHFRVTGAEKAVIVRIHGDAGDTLTFRSPSAKVRIPGRRWRTLLANNRGRTFEVAVFAERADGTWDAYDPFPVRVARETVDNTLVYREIGPVYLYWNRMRLVQRNLENFRTSVILDNRRLGTACMNCHGFLDNDPGRMVMHVRRGPGPGTLLVDGRDIRKIDTRTDFNDHAAFASWHPSGDRIAFSVHAFKQFFHALGENRDVVDLSSDLIVYDIRTHTVTTDPRIADPAWMETWPAWSADGRFLYFCRAPRPEDWNLPYPEIARIRYDLVRIAYDEAEGFHGEVETVVDSRETGLSAAQPRVSPDGRWILFCLAEHGTFTAFRPSSDLYLLDTATGRFRKADCNSGRSESHHGWSSNSRWIVFGSKRRDGIHTLSYFSYVDGDGNCHKPFLLPREDPDDYAAEFMNYQLPELIVRPVPLPESRFIRAIYDRAVIRAGLDPEVRLREESAVSTEMWLPGETRE